MFSKNLLFAACTDFEMAYQEGDFFLAWISMIFIFLLGGFPDVYFNVEIDAVLSEVANPNKGTLCEKVCKSRGLPRHENTKHSSSTHQKEMSDH